MRISDWSSDVCSSDLAALVAAARDEMGAAGLVSHLLVYLPTVLDLATPAVRRANVPLGWAAPAFDVLQLADYDGVTGGRGAETAGAPAALAVRLGYPVEEQRSEERRVGEECVCTCRSRWVWLRLKKKNRQK